jgi:predicted O-linked N-acetylglucosamine transferase (SPINDLY family)
MDEVQKLVILSWSTMALAQFQASSKFLNSQRGRLRVSRVSIDLRDKFVAYILEVLVSDLIRRTERKFLQ